MFNVTVISSEENRLVDICLLEVPNLTDSQPEACNDCWSPVCLPENHVEAGTLCYVSGWGKSGWSESTLSEEVFLIMVIIINHHFSSFKMLAFIFFPMNNALRLWWALKFRIIDFAQVLLT